MTEIEPSSDLEKLVVLVAKKCEAWLARLTRDACRAAISKERRRAVPNGDVELELKRSRADGTGAIGMTELEL